MSKYFTEQERTEFYKSEKWISIKLNLFDIRGKEMREVR